MPNQPLTIEEAVNKIKRGTTTPQTAQKGQPISIEEGVRRIKQESPQTETQGGGLLQGAANIVRDVTKPVATLATRPFQLGQELGTRAQEALTGQKLNPQEALERQTVNLPFFGEISPTRQFGEGDVIRDIGRGAQTVALGVGGPATKVATTIGRMGQFARSGAIGGGLFGAGAQVEDTGEVSGETLNQGAVGAITGGLIGGALGRFSGGTTVPGTSGLQRAAESQIGRVLAPAGRFNKQTVQKIAPEILRRRLVALSDDELLQQAQKGKTEALEAMNTTYANLPAAAKVDTAPIFLSITKAKNGLVTDSGIVIKAKQAQFDVLDDLEKELAEIVRRGGKEIGNIREYRQQLDDVISDAGKGFNFDARDKATLKAQKILANSIRSEIAKQFPDVAKVNKDFTFWSRLIDILEAKAERKTGQTGFTKTLGTITGGAVGSAGGGVSGAITGAIIIRTLIDFMQSTAWNSFSAVQKSRLSDLISKGKFNEALQLLEKAGAPIRATSRFAPVVGAEAVTDQ